MCEQALEDPKGSCQYQFWHELIIRTNVARDLMMLANVECPEELAADRMTRLNKELKEFFEKGEGQKCCVTSLYTRVMYTYVHLTLTPVLWTQPELALMSHLLTSETISFANFYCLLIYLVTLYNVYNVRWKVAVSEG